MAWPDVASLITPPRTELDLENQYALPHVRGAPQSPNGLTFRAQEGPPGESGPTWGKEGMQPGVVGLRGALIAASVWPDLVAPGTDPALLGTGRTRACRRFAGDRRTGSEGLAVADPAQEPWRCRGRRAVCLRGRLVAREPGCRVVSGDPGR